MAENEDTTGKRQHIVFKDACQPTLTAGEYRITATQAIDVHGMPDTFIKSKSFWVSGPRFSLDPSDIYSVYPPASHEGEYHNCLPHIVFTRKTLPWERLLDGEPRRDGTPPWMTLLLFDEDEIEEHKIKIKTVKLQDLLEDPSRPSGDAVLRPDIDADPHCADRSKRDPWESLEEQCKVIDVPEPLFNSVVPAAEELPYLAHVRQVDMSDKEIAAIAADGWFSVALGNRLPSQGKRNTVFLVSLEGHRNRLHDPSRKTDDNRRVRLVVLMSWTFRDKGPDFLSLVEKLAEGAEQLRIKPAPGTSDATVRKALDLGYTALNHTTRLGEATVSWYRGPLVPLSMAKEPYNDLHESADAALRYDPETGLFDISYAAAWQLGRLLALHKPEFALSLYNWRSGYIHKVALDLAEKLLEMKYVKELEYGKRLNFEDTEELLRDDLMASLLMELWTSYGEPENKGQGEGQ